MSCFSEARDLEVLRIWEADVPHSVVAGADGATLAELSSPPRGDRAGLERLPPSPVRLS